MRWRIVSSAAAAGYDRQKPSTSPRLGSATAAPTDEMPGVIADGDPRLRQLEAALGIDGVRVAAIGAYATPYTVPAAPKP